MHTLQDENTFALNNYMHQQDSLEKDWELSKPEKCDDVIEYAKKIMEGGVSKQEFAWVFNDFYLDGDFDDDIYVDGFQEALDKWNLGNPPSDELEYEMLWKIAHTSLDGASQILYDIEFESLFDNLGRAIKGVIANDN